MGLLHHHATPKRRIVITAAGMMLMLVLNECHIVAAMKVPNKTGGNAGIGNLPGNSNQTISDAPGSSLASSQMASTAADEDVTSSNGTTNSSGVPISVPIRDYVIWKFTRKPVATKYGVLGIAVVLDSPCLQLNQSMFFTNSTFTYAVNRCNLEYEEYRKEFKEMCPQMISDKSVPHFFQDSSSGTRISKRFIFTSIILGIVVVGLIYSTWKNSQDIGKLTEDAKTTRINEAEMARSISSLNDRINQVIGIQNTFAEQFGKYVEMGVVTAFEVTLIVSAIQNNLRDLKEAKREWRNDKLSAQFFDNLGITSPCALDCPFQFGTPLKCAMNKARDIVYMQVKLPIIDRSKKLYTGTPFDVLVQNETSYCKLRYAGQTAFVVSNDSNCLVPIDANVNAANGNYLMLDEDTCNYQEERDLSDSFAITECKAKKANYHLSFTSRVNGDEASYIYCPGGTYQLPDKNITKCGDYIETIPLSKNVTMNGKLYKAGVEKLGLALVKVRRNKIYREKVKKLITPVFDISHLLLVKKDLNLTLQERGELPKPGLDFGIITGFFDTILSLLPNLSWLKWIGIGIAVVLVIPVLYTLFLILKCCLCLCNKVKSKSKKNIGKKKGNKKRNVKKQEKKVEEDEEKLQSNNEDSDDN